DSVPSKLLASSSATLLRTKNRSTPAAHCCRQRTHSIAYGVDILVGRLGFEPRQRDSKSLDLPLVDRPVCRRPVIAGEATLRTFSPSKLPWAKSPSGESGPRFATQPTGRAVELPAHLPRTGKVQTEPNPNLKAPHTTLELQSRYPSINA